jgi:hypothetical protein
MNENDDEGKQRKTVGRPFEPADARINRHGAPAFHAFRKQALEIANEKIIGPDGKEITRGEALLRSWLKSRQPKLQELFAFYAWGKPADRLETNALEPGTRLILHWPNELDREPSPFDHLPPNMAREARRRLKGPEGPL